MIGGVSSGSFGQALKLEQKRGGRMEKLDDNTPWRSRIESNYSWSVTWQIIRRFDVLFTFFPLDNS